MRHGAIPYHSLYVEYPPGALPVFAAPEVVARHYGDAFAILMAVFGALALLAVANAAGALRLSTLELARSLVPIAVAPVLLGSFFLNRFDPWPMLLVALALAAFLHGRLRTGAAAFAVGVLAKVYPLAAAPVLAVHVLRTAGREGLRRALRVFVAVCAVGLVPFAILGPGGLAFSVYQQFTRHLEVESLGGSLLLALHRLGAYRADVVLGNLNSFDLVGTLPALVGVVSTLAALAALLGCAVWYARGSTGRGRLALAVAAAIVGYVAFGKVLSTQYVVWLLPLVPLVRGRLGWAATGLLLAAMGLTNLESTRIDSLASALAPGPGALAVLLGRNLVLVALFVLLAIGLRPRPQERAAAAPEPCAA